MRSGIQPVSSLVKASGPQLEVALPSKRHSAMSEDSACYCNLWDGKQCAESKDIANTLQCTEHKSIRSKIAMLPPLRNPCLN